VSPPEWRARSNYADAFGKLASRIAVSLGNLAPGVLPVSMYVAGGAALHFYTGERVSIDVDAAFSHRIALPKGLEVAYHDEDGTSRLLYFDLQYNDTLGLMHENAYAESIALPVPGIDPRILDVRVLAPIDLAISKLSRFSAQDRHDIASLASLGLITADALQARAEEALVAYVGDLERLRGNIRSAASLIASAGRPAT